MNNIDCGPARAQFDFGNDGIVHGAFSGLITSTNGGVLSGLLLEAGATEGAVGVLASVDRSLVALAPIVPQHYKYVPPKLSDIPVAIIVTAEQMAVYAGVAEAAALYGAMRRAFLSAEQAQAWLREQVRALSANRAWWSGRRLPR